MADSMPNQSGMARRTALQIFDLSRAAAGSILITGASSGAKAQDSSLGNNQLGDALAGQLQHGIE